MARRRPTRKRRERPTTSLDAPPAAPPAPAAPVAPDAPASSRLPWLAFAAALAGGAYTPWRAITFLQSVRDTAGG